MRSLVDGDPRLVTWRHVREFAVPPSMIEAATARRLAGDWAGACVAARVDPELNPRAIGRRHGREQAAEIRADLHHLAPDLLRWHLPRVATGRLRPGLTVSLARYTPRLHLVARTAPDWADADQRITLALWDGGLGGVHPHPRPNRRFRLDLHRHLWDARHAAELRERAGAETWPVDPDGFAVHRWRAEADLLRHAEGRAEEPVFVRVSSREYRPLRTEGVRDRESLVLPDAATRVPPDLELLRAGLIEPGQLHPLVADALAPGHPSVTRGPSAAVPRVVDCRGEQHRIGLVDGVLSPLDHDPGELRREEILVAFGGTPLPCLQMIDRALRRPESLADIRARLDHGDLPGALAAVEHLLGPDAVLRDGPLRDELARTEQRHLTYGLYRAGLTGHCPPKNVPLPRRRPKVTK
ncbi:hypothetical protein [Actinoplanes regularis]|uniref:Uncharacterized protein n=1 Tax=Actinoplanes regularis TaxID=52697 RepID=A0A238Y833_9ACTN|nr:hypothetical protein [Actinoplanes regularis]GIE86160.1 hypothetical protein Are01nite_26400 [Actinoplanes regularis]SNR66509.1 hypothetical protein SAMN06264365_104290 [Actinoplanes regularis]